MNTLITVLFMVLVVMAVAHFLYEAIALPSVRTVHRFKLFALRDRLRRLKIEHSDGVSDDAFSALDTSLSWQLENQHRLTLSMVGAGQRRYERDSDFKKEVDERLKLLRSCTLPEFKAIHREAADHFMHTVAANCGMFLAYLLPAFWAWMRMKQILLTVNQLVALPDRQLDALAPQCA